MSIKHALVVDDSKSARLSLKRMLEQHHLVVELAESGEEALDFLDHQTVDVIFMDHTMPGMDGLEAVAAIKRNPRTAMIPVMMYTTKEGEVYVGQARALGALGVLPKEVQPQQLFDMLVKLGLVTDKRKPGAPIPAERPSRRAEDAPRDGAPPPEGIPLESLVRRMLEDQQQLRTELMEHQREFAKQVAAEIREAQRVEIVPPLAEVAPPVVSLRGWTLLFAVTAVVLAVLWWNARGERDAALAAVERAVVEPGPELAARLSALENALHAERTYAQADYSAAIDALQWALNRDASFPFDSLAFDDAQAGVLRELLTRLESLDFRGRVRLEAHLGEFCLEPDDAGGYRLAAADLPLEACSLLGHPLDDSSFVSERQSVGFAEFLATSPLANDSGIEVELVAHDRARSLRLHPFPSDIATAGDWNRIAERNNRIETSLVIDRSAVRHGAEAR